MSTELFSLAGRTALVTGSSRGLGHAIADGFAAAGAALVLNGSDPARLATAASALREKGYNVTEAAFDVTNESAVCDAFAKLDADGIAVDILVNNAGIQLRKLLVELSVAEWQRVIDTNLTSAFVCSHAAYPHMKKAGGGKIINIGSMMSIFAAPFSPAYAASKGGIVQFTRSCACAWAADNIQANAILPGWIDTDLTRRARQEDRKSVV